MATATEETLINNIADFEREIAGVKNSYNAYANPDSLNNADLPAVLHFPEGFDSDTKAHHNIHENVLVIASILFVKPRQAMGGKLAFLENEAQPFLYKWRHKFQASATLDSLYAAGQRLSKFRLLSGRYAAGGPFLTHNGIEYIGCIFRYECIEIN